MRLPHQLALALAHLAERAYWLRPPRLDPILTVDSVRMSKHPMFFSSAKARNALGYESRPASEAIIDAVDWFRDNRYC